MIVISSDIIHPCDPTVVIFYLIWSCDIAVHITYLISHSSPLSCYTVIKTNGYKLVLPSGGPSGKYTKY